MHELAITEQILKIALSHAQKANARQVTGLHLQIGALSTIVDESVQFYWDIISQDSLCQGATLHFEHVPAALHCLDCQHEYTLQNGLTACPNCDSLRVQITAGQEFQLTSIEVN